MVRCCVPLCKCCSNDTKGISYHEFPVNYTLKQKWIKHIPRKNWNPRETDRVCSLHFNLDDYKPDLKIKQLKPGVIPRIFPNHPTRIQTEAESDIPQTTEIIHGSGAGGSQYLQRLSLSNSHSVDGRVKDAFSIRKKLRGEINRNQRLEKRIRKLKDELKRVKSTLEQFEKSSFVDGLLTLSDDAESGNASAAFLVQQIRAYGKQRVHWDRKVLEKCHEWRRQCPRGYEFPRENKLLRLPNKFTIEKFVKGNSDSNDAIDLPASQGPWCSCDPRPQTFSMPSSCC